MAQANQKRNNMSNQQNTDAAKKSKDRCWTGYEPVPGKKAYSPGSCRKSKSSSGKKPKK